MLGACGGATPEPPRPETVVSVDRADGLRVRISGTAVSAIAASGTWLAWGVSVVREREVDDPHELLVLDTVSGEQRTVAATAPGGVLTAFAGTGGRFVVRELRFETGCGDGGAHGCASWLLWTYDPATEARVDIGRSDRARSQDANPMVVAGPRWVAWQESRDDGTHLRVLHDDASQPVTAYTSRYRATSLAVAGDAVVFDDTDRGGRLLRISPGRGAVSTVVTAPVTHLPAAGTTFVSWFGGSGDKPTRLYVAPLSATRSERQLARSEQMYWQLGHGDRLVYGELNGVWLVDGVSRGARPKALPAQPDHGVGYAFGPDGRLYYGTTDGTTFTETTIVTA